MEKQLQYVPLTKDDEEHCAVFAALMYPYIDEMNEHSDRPLPKPYQKKWIDSIIAMQGSTDRHLELCYVEEKPIGFLYGKLDHSDHKGYIRPGWGYIMEFYVQPAFRRCGYGRRMFARLEELFRADGAQKMYLTADPVTGKPFWEAMGFVNTQVGTTWEKSPDNGLYLYEKEIILN